jgi:hypothetical protein
LVTHCCLKKKEKEEDFIPNSIDKDWILIDCTDTEREREREREREKESWEDLRDKGFHILSRILHWSGLQETETETEREWKGFILASRSV